VAIKRPDFKLFNIGIKIHWSWWIFVGFLCSGSLFSLDLIGLAWNLWISLLLLIIVISHELAHALTARKFGHETEGIIMHLVGGVALIATMGSMKPREEFWVSLAGPAFNIATFLFVLPLLILASHGSLAGEASMVQPDQVSEVSSFLIKRLSEFASINLILGVFNLVPAYPMDGGRILRSGLLISKLDPILTTNIAHAVSVISALGFLFWGFSAGAPFLILIALLVLGVIYMERTTGARI